MQTGSGPTSLRGVPVWVWNVFLKDGVEFDTLEMIGHKAYLDKSPERKATLIAFVSILVISLLEKLNLLLLPDMAWLLMIFTLLLIKMKF